MDGKGIGLGSIRGKKGKDADKALSIGAKTLGKAAKSGRIKDAVAAASDATRKAERKR